jgi:CHAT domain-containing protein/tetratricopeptide (TPR) repeat protein
LADCLVEQGYLAQALPLREKAEAIWRNILWEGRPISATNYQWIASSLTRQGKHAQAQPLFEKALAVWRKERGESHAVTARSYLTLAQCLESRRQYGRALPLYDKALAIHCQSFGELHAETALSYYALAQCLIRLGREMPADPLLEKSLEIRRKVLGDEHPHTADTYQALGHCKERQGKYAQAQRLFMKGLEIRRKVLGEEHPKTATSYTRLGLTAYLRGDIDRAELFAEKAARGYQSARVRVASAGLDRTAFGAIHSPLQLLAILKAGRGKPEEAWQSLEGDLSRGLLDDLLFRQTLRATDIERLQQAIAELNHLERQITALHPNSDSFEIVCEARDQATARFRVLQQQLEHTYGVAAGKVYPLSDIQRLLPPTAAFIGWVDGGGRLSWAYSDRAHWACVIRSAGKPRWVPLSGSGERGHWTAADQDLPARFRRLCRPRPAPVTTEWQRVAAELRAQRISSLDAVLGAHDGLPRVRHLIVLPSPAMAGIPIEALTDRYTVSYAPSGTVFAWLQEQRLLNVDQKSINFLALGDPAFPPPKTHQTVAKLDQAVSQALRGPTFQPLRGTRGEVDTIATLIRQHGGRVETLLGRDASRKSLGRLARHPGLDAFQYLHLATHGVPDPRAGLNSHLALAPADPDHDADQLAAAEMLTWKLRAELVTLSACSTALGQHLGGEGYLGFAQPLFLAGARSVVLSQWPVDDTATRLLMERFYRNMLGQRKGLDRPLGKALALHEAKQWLRRLSTEEARRLAAPLPRERGDDRPLPPRAPEVPRYAHPYYWASFILVGDPGDLSQDLPAAPTAAPAPIPPVPSRATWPWWAGATLAFVFLGAAIWRWRPGTRGHRNLALGAQQAHNPDRGPATDGRFEQPGR